MAPKKIDGKLTWLMFSVQLARKEGLHPVMHKVKAKEVVGVEILGSEEEIKWALAVMGKEEFDWSPQ